MDKKEVLKKFKKVILLNDISTYDFDSLDEDVNQAFVDAGLGAIEIAEYDRDLEDPDVYNLVVKLDKFNLYFAIFGSYDSWNGCNFKYAEWEIVKPVEKTYTSWKLDK